MTSKADFYFLSDKIDYMTEDEEFMEEVFKDKVRICRILYFISIINSQAFRAIFEKIQDYIDIIYFSDTQAFTTEPYGMFLSFDLDFSKKSPEESFSDITLFVHAFIDQLSLNSPKISSQYKKAAEKRRAEYEKVKSKELQEKNPEVSISIYSVRKIPNKIK